MMIHDVSNVQFIRIQKEKQQTNYRSPEGNSEVMGFTASGWLELRISTSISTNPSVKLRNFDTCCCFHNKLRFAERKCQ